MLANKVRILNNISDVVMTLFIIKKIIRNPSAVLYPSF